MAPILHCQRKYVYYMLTDKDDKRFNYYEKNLLFFLRP